MYLYVLRVLLPLPVLHTEAARLCVLTPSLLLSTCWQEAVPPEDRSFSPAPLISRSAGKVQSDLAKKQISSGVNVHAGPLLLQTTALFCLYLGRSFASFVSSLHHTAPPSFLRSGVESGGMRIRRSRPCVGRQLFCLEARHHHIHSVFLSFMEKGIQAVLGPKCVPSRMLLTLFEKGKKGKAGCRA